MNSLRRLFIAALLVLGSHPASAEIIGTDSFDYPDGAIVGRNGGGFWNFRNLSPVLRSGGRSDWDDITPGATVSSARLVTLNQSAKREYNGPGEGFPPSDEAVGAVNDNNPATSVYYRVTLTTGATLPTFFGLSSYDFGTERLFFGKPSGSTTFGIDVAGAVTHSTTTIAANTSYTLVTRIDYAANVIALYINPNLQAAEPASPTVSLAYTGTNWSTAVRLASSGGSSITWDDLVVATAWDDLGRTVVTTLADEDDGTLGGGAGISLREAVKYSPSGNLITFAPGLSGQTMTLTHADGDMEIPGALSIDATALPGGLTISANNASRHFLVDSGKSLTLRGLTLTKGEAVVVDEWSGASILNRGTLVVDRCHLSGNTAFFSFISLGGPIRRGTGGAISNEGTLTMTHSTLSNNKAGKKGGAIYNNGTLTMSQCKLFRNWVAGGPDPLAVFDFEGGGALSSSGTIGATETLTECKFFENYSAHFGGAVVGGINTTLTRCSFDNNSCSSGGGAVSGSGQLLQCTLFSNSTSGFGGAIATVLGSFSLQQCTLTGNFAFDRGGAISGITDSVVSLVQCTVAGNSASNIGGAIAISNAAGSNPPLTLNHSIVAGNTAPGSPDIHGAVIPSGVNLIGSLAGTTPVPNSGILTGAPLLSSLGDYGGPTQTMFPLPGSPALDAGGLVGDATDQRGFARHRDGDGNGSSHSDLGAVEVSMPPVTNGSDAGPGSLRQALLNAAAPASNGPDLIYFSSGVSVITLAGEIIIDDPGGVVLDATDRPTGLVIDAGPASNRHFRITAGSKAVFNRLRLYGGGGSGGGTPLNYGGSIHNSGNLTLRECTLADNSSTNAAGAVYNQAGALTVERSTFHHNTAGSAGAILHESLTPMTILTSTFAKNTALLEGGAITVGNFRPATITHSTISGNHVIQTGGSGGGGIRTTAGAGNLLTLTYSIVTGNTDANSPGEPNVNPGPGSTGNLTSGEASLAALGHYGGPTWTMPPMAGSPAIDAAANSATLMDQRGMTPDWVPFTVPPPPSGAFQGLFFPPDIGAVEAPRTLVVTTAADKNDGPDSTPLSLREAIRDAEAGATILFDPTLFNGQPADTIVLSQALGEISFNKGLILNASANTGGVIIDGGSGANRIFHLPSGTGASLHRFTFVGGNGSGTIDSNSGGAILCRSATLALADCLLAGNSATDGGAIYNFNGTLTLDRCLLVGNAASSNGGAILSQTDNLTGPATSFSVLTNCTLTANSATDSGGGIYNLNGRATLLHCTLTGNLAPAAKGSGIASYSDNRTRTMVHNCILGGNANASDVTFVPGSTNSFLSLGGNVIGSGNATGAFNQTRDSTNVAEATARLAPLADYGGPTQTIALRPGSPARDIATPSPVTTDQRGFGIVLGPKDSGAYEAGNYFLESFNVFSQEFLPPTASGSERARTFDFDSDGQTNEAEWLAVTNAADPNSRFAASLSLDEGDLEISFPTVTGRTYRLQQSSTLLNGSWLDSGLTPKNGNNALQNFIVTPTTGPARRFYRVLVSLP